MTAAPAHESALTLTSTSPEQTQRIGRTLIDLLPDGALVALYGDLGAGKTCLVRGMAEALGARDLVTSPTFTVVHEYGGPRPIYHLDLYRITDPRQILDLGYEELFTPGHGVCVVEWAEHAESMLPPSRVDIRLEHADRNSRRISIGNAGILRGDWQKPLVTAPE